MRPPSLRAEQGQELLGHDLQAGHGAPHRALAVARGGRDVEGCTLSTCEKRSRQRVVDGPYDPRLREAKFLNAIIVVSNNDQVPDQQGPWRRTKQAQRRCRPRTATRRPRSGGCSTTTWTRRVTLAEPNRGTSSSWSGRWTVRKSPDSTPSCQRPDNGSWTRAGNTRCSR